jgi:transposase
MLGKKLDKPRRKYDAEFKEDVLKMVFSGRAVQEIATSLGINVSMIHKWRAQHTDALGSSRLLAPIVIPAVPGAEHERIKARLREVEQERDILKKRWAFSAGGLKDGVCLYFIPGTHFSGNYHVPCVVGEPELLLRLPQAWLCC